MHVTRLAVGFMWIASLCASVSYGMRHGIVVDAGSSGSRARLYRWSSLTLSSPTLRIEESASFSLKSGVDDHLMDHVVVEGYIRELMAGTRRLLDSNHHATTPLYFMATGGVRALGDKGLHLMANISLLLQDTDVNPFLFKSSHAVILSGNEEAYYAWIAANYLQGVFDPDESTPDDVGIVELGGSSVQMSFMPHTVIQANKAVLTLLQQKYELYANSYQTFGTNAMIYKIREKILERDPFAMSIQDPCGLKGDLSHTFAYQGLQYPVEGTGDVEGCLSVLESLVYRAPDHLCFTKPCGLAGFYQPVIPRNMTFYGLGAMKYSLRAIGALQDDGSFTLRDVLHMSKSHCQKTYREVQEETGRDDPYLSSDCTVSLYLPILLHKAFGFELDSTNILATTKIDGQNTEWSLGAMIYTEARFPEEHTRRKEPDCPITFNSASSLSSAMTLMMLVTARLLLW